MRRAIRAVNQWLGDGVALLRMLLKIIRETKHLPGAPRAAMGHG
jgi:hypothetical protein